MAKTYIIGHQKPDTDSVVAAMALSYVYEQISCFGYSEPEAVIADPLNPETQFLFDKFGIKAPRQIKATDIEPEDKVVLVDHNEVSQRLTGLNQEQIVEIVDHHKPNLNFSQPIFLTFKTWGSSASIVYYLMKQKQIEPGKELASLMLAAILSDTIGFKSATATNNDRKFGQELAKLAKIDDIPAFTLEIFRAKSNLGDLSAKELVKNDYKEYDFGQTVMIGQVETVEQAEIISQRKTELLAAMAEIKAEQNLDYIYLAITNILQANTKLLILGPAEKELAKTAFSAETQDQIMDIGPKMSRKKQIAPAIEQALSA